MELFIRSFVGFAVAFIAAFYFIFLAFGVTAVFAWVIIPIVALPLAFIAVKSGAINMDTF